MFVRILGSPQKARRNSKNRDGNLDWNLKFKKIRKQARMMKRGAEISGGGEKEQATWGKITVQLEEINQKVLAKERRLKRY